MSLIEGYCEGKGLVILGYYYAPLHPTDTGVSALAKTVSSRIRENSANGVAVLARVMFPPSYVSCFAGYSHSRLLFAR
jgi:hypothetical protein